MKGDKKKANWIKLLMQLNSVQSELKSTVSVKATLNCTLLKVFLSYPLVSWDDQCRFGRGVGCGSATEGLEKQGGLKKIMQTFILSYT